MVAALLFTDAADTGRSIVACYYEWRMLEDVGSRREGVLSLHVSIVGEINCRKECSGMMQCDEWMAWVVVISLILQGESMLSCSCHACK